MPTRFRILLLSLLLPLLVSCGDADERGRLVGRAVLPADTIEPGPRVGRELAPVINGRPMPMEGFPVQGFSSVIPLDRDRLLVLQDNGFGTRANSPAFPLHWFTFDIDWAEEAGQEGEVKLAGITRLRDPQRHLQDTPADGLLTGANLDPESFVRLDDGSFWIGEEFGPYLVHVDSSGVLLEAPVSAPLPAELKLYGREADIFMSPDHPELRHQADAPQLANVPRSGGFEGMALSPDGQTIYAALEKGMIEDPNRRRRIILTFDPAARTFAEGFHSYQVDAAGVSIAALDAAGPGRLLVTERDGGEGESARIKRVYRVDLDEQDEQGHLIKTLVCDLLDLADEKGLTRAEDGAVGLGPDYRFPYITPECLALLDDHTLLVINDNNYPMDTGRRPGLPDDSEFILVRLDSSPKP